jgi:hypothetical protein
MSSYVDNTFITHFSSEWAGKFQQQESVLRKACRTINNVVGNTFRVPTYESVTATVNKPRHADVAPANIQMGQVTGTMQDLTAGDYIDDLDTFKSNADQRMIFIEALTNSINVQIDRIILDALNLCSNTEISASLGNVYNAALASKANALLTDQFVKYQERYAVISTGALEDALADPKLVNRDYVDSDSFKNGYFKGIMGFDHIIYPTLPDNTWTGGASAVTSGKKRCFWWAKNALVLGVGAEPKITIEYIPQKFATFIGVKASVGAVIARTEGVQRAQIDN